MEIRTARALLRGVTERPVERLGPQQRAGDRDLLVVEEPLELRIDGETVAVTMRTPGADEDLALGFLLAEGLIRSAADVGSIAPCGRPGEEGYGNVIDVRSAAGRPIEVERVLESRRFTTTTASCGVCGRESIEGLLERCEPLPPGPAVRPELVSRAVEGLRPTQANFARTGGLHAAALVGRRGEVIATAEDVGRHNAVDKVVGALLRAPGSRPAILAVSGRTSFEIVQKAAAARVPIVAGVSAASSLAVDLATRTRSTLAAFVRGGSMNVYAGTERLLPGVFEIDEEDGGLDLLPLAARRALDAAGVRPSLEQFRSWPHARRRALQIAGAADEIDVAAVRALCPDAPPAEVAPPPWPDGVGVDPARLAPLERWAVAALHARGRHDKLERLLGELSSPLP